MPPAPPAVDSVTNVRDQARPIGTPAPAAVPGGRGRRRWAQVLPLRRSASLAQTARPAVACQGARSAEGRGNRPRRLAGLLRWAPKNARSYHDPLFDRPDLVENDYYRLRNYPSG